MIVKYVTSFKEGVCIPLCGNTPLGGNNLFAACYGNVGRKKLLKTINP